MSDDGVGRGPVSPELDRSGIDGFESVRWAWQQLGGYAQYFFQSPEWIDLAAAQLEGDLAWGVVTESGRPAAVSVLRRSRLMRAGIGIRVLSDVRVADMMYPFSDCVLDAKPDVRPTVALPPTRVVRTVRGLPRWHGYRTSSLALRRGAARSLSDLCDGGRLTRPHQGGIRRATRSSVARKCPHGQPGRGVLRRPRCGPDRLYGLAELAPTVGHGA